MKLLSKQKEIPLQKKTRWPHQVTTSGNAFDLDAGGFSLNDPRVIARSLRRSPERRRRRKSNSFRSAVSVLNGYIDRVGYEFTKRQRGRIAAAKAKLHLVYHRKFGG